MRIYLFHLLEIIANHQVESSSCCGLSYARLTGASLSAQLQRYATLAHWHLGKMMENPNLSHPHPGRREDNSLCIDFVRTANSALVKKSPF